MTNKQLIIEGMQGLGDNVFQRPFIKALSREWDVFLETAWPELYADLPVKFVNPQTRLRTQAKNAARSKIEWAARPSGCKQVKRNSYVNAFRGGRSIIAGMEESFGIKLNAADFDLPLLPPPPIVTSKPIAFVRPVTLRREWYNAARNPDPKYIADIVETLRPTHHIVAVADIEPGAEWLIGPALRSDRDFIAGQLLMMDMLALLTASDIVLGGVGYIVPASIALKRHCFVVLGGQGGHNAPDKILDRRLDCSRIGFAMPENFCRCTSMRHNCNKTISNLQDQWRNYCQRHGLNGTANWSGTISELAGIRSAPASSPMTAPISSATSGKPTAISAAP
jgi:hypothetical protein